MSVAAAAVVADLTRPELVPGLRHVQDHAVPVERLEREGHVRGDSGQEARVGVAVGIGRLAPLPFFLRLSDRSRRRRKLADGDLAQDAQALIGVAAECAARFRSALAVGRRLHHEDADGVDVVVRVSPRVGTLVEPVERDAALAGVERIEVLEPACPVGAAGEGRRHAAGRHHAVGIALSLVQARSADQAKWRPLGKAGATACRRSPAEQLASAR